MILIIPSSRISGQGVHLNLMQLGFMVLGGTPQKGD